MVVDVVVDVVASILLLVLHATMGDLASKYLYNVTLFDDDRATVYVLQTWYLYSRLHEHSYQFEASLRLVSTCTCVLLASFPGHYKIWEWPGNEAIVYYGVSS